jgi:hypothetical protein
MDPGGREWGIRTVLYPLARRITDWRFGPFLDAFLDASSATEVEHGTVARLLELLDIDRARLAAAARAAVAS